MNQADGALYESKRLGRNRVTAADIGQTALGLPKEAEMLPWA